MFMYDFDAVKYQLELLNSMYEKLCFFFQFEFRGH